MSLSPFYVPPLRLFIAFFVLCAGSDLFLEVKGDEDIRDIWTKIITREPSVYPERGNEALSAFLLSFLYLRYSTLRTSDSRLIFIHPFRAFCTVLSDI